MDEVTYCGVYKEGAVAVFRTRKGKEEKNNQKNGNPKKGDTTSGRSGRTPLRKEQCGVPPKRRNI
jgi:hypothetical protein